MTSRDFAYWLQGYFELFPTASADITLDDGQERCVRRHIDLVCVTEKEPSQLTADIRAALDVGIAMSNAGGKGARAAMTTVIRERLAHYFEHVIDKQHPQPEKAQAAHNPRPGGNRLMC